MPRTYKPRPKVTMSCACGCGRLVTGNAKRRYYNQSCRMRAYRSKGPMATTPDSSSF